MTNTPQEKFRKIQRFISRMPSLSTTVSKVLEICNDPKSSPNDLNKVISFDPVLTGQVLKLINSAYYGLPNRIASLTRAIIMLGLNTVKNLVLATSILGSFKGNRGMRGLLIDQFWEHSLGVGVTARVLARILDVPIQEQEAYFVTGLLHDLGKLPIMSSFPALYEEVFKLNDEMNMRSYQAETHLLGFDHCHVNRLIFARWKLGATMTDAAVCHHKPFDPDVQRNQLLLCICLADETMLGFKGQTPQTETADGTLTDRLAQALEIDAQRIIGLQKDIELQIEKARIFLNINVKGK